MSSDLSCRAKWARRLVREKVAAQLTALALRPDVDGDHRLHDVTPSFPSFGAGQTQNPLKLPKLYPRSQPKGMQKLLDPKDSAEWRVSIIGAGTAGLYIAMILDDLQVPGLKYDLLEASGRIGGRCYTHYFSKMTHDYYDIGAMRFPKVCSSTITTVLRSNIVRFRQWTRHSHCSRGFTCLSSNTT